MNALSEKPLVSDTAAAIALPVAAMLSDADCISELETTAQKARDYAAAAHAPNTRRAYRADLADFGAWCANRNLQPLPAEPAVLGLYLTHLAERGAKFATIRRRVTAINGVHRDHGLASPSAHPEVRRILQGVARTIGTVQKRKSALTIDVLLESLGSLDRGVKGTRDRAMLLLGFGGAFRRSELAALDVADLTFSRKGLVVALRRSKTDQTGEGRDVPVLAVPKVDRDPVRAVKSWLEVARIESGPLFRVVTPKGVVTEERISDKALARLVQRATKGLVGDFAAHSLRAGFVTSCAERKVPDRDIAGVTGHKSMQVLGGYVRRANVLDNTALLEVMK